MALRSQTALLAALLCNPATAGATPRRHDGGWQRLDAAAPPLRQLLFDSAAAGRWQQEPERGLSREERLWISRSNTLVATIAVGTPPQEMTCLIDSGTSDLWLPSQRCETCESSRSFRAGDSSTFKPRTQRTEMGRRALPVHVSIGSGRVVGYPVEDTVNIGSVTLQNQSFIIVEEADLPPNRTWDGICGLGWVKLATGGEPLYKHIQAEGKKAIFTLAPKEEYRASLTVGGDDVETVCKAGTLSQTPVAGAGLGDLSGWTTDGGLAIHEKDPVKTNFVIDTGSAFILAPPQSFQAFVDSMFPDEVFDEKCGVDHGLVVCDCSVVSAVGMLPLRVHLGERDFTLSVQQLFKKVSSTDGKDLCLLQVQKKRGFGTFKNLLGDLFDGLGGLLGGRREGIDHSSPYDQMDDDSSGFFDGFPEDGLHGSLDSFPRDGLLGGLAGGSLDLDNLVPPFDLPMDLNFSTSSSSQEIQEVAVSMPNGTACSQNIVWRDGELVSNSTSCTESDHDRRLQSEDFVLPGQFPLGSTAPGLEYRTEYAWILGGVFLNHVVTIFDFESQRVGFCEPLEEPSSNGETLSPSDLYSVQTTARIKSSTGSNVAVGCAGMGLVVFAFIAAVAASSRRARSVDVSPLVIDDNDPEE